MADKDRGKGLAVGAVIGAIAGVITGILFAPKSGKETRQDIKDGASKASDKLQVEAAKVQKEAKQLITKVEKIAKEKSGKASETAKRHATKAKKSANDLKTVVSSFKAGEASDKDLNDAIKKVKSARTSLKNFLKK
jgi:gas vesicle protein